MLRLSAHPCLVNARPAGESSEPEVGHSLEQEPPPQSKHPTEPRAGTQSASEAHGPEETVVPAARGPAPPLLQGGGQASLQALPTRAELGRRTQRQMDSARCPGKGAPSSHGRAGPLCPLKRSREEPWGRGLCSPALGAAAACPTSAWAKGSPPLTGSPLDNSLKSSKKPKAPRSGSLDGVTAAGTPLGLLLWPAADLCGQGRANWGLSG